jgi:hypothetical protein
MPAVRTLAWVIVWVLVVPLVIPSSATPAPSPSLFPLTPGATWVRRDDDGTDAVSRVAGTKVVGSRQCVVVERRAVERGRERVDRTCFLATATEVLVLEMTGFRGEQQVVNPPRPVLKLPPKAGQTWTWSPANPLFELTLTSKWIGEETIRVSAGTFRAWKLQTVTTGENIEITTVTWYAPGVGAVRTERKGHRGDRQISGWSELVSYKIP